MKKFLSVFIVAFFAIFMMAGSAWTASEIDICPQPLAPPAIFDADVVGAVSGAVTVDALWTRGDPVVVDLGNSLEWPNLPIGRERCIAYNSDAALTGNSTLKFTFTNGAVKADPSLFLLAWNTAPYPSPGGWVTVGTLNDFGVDTYGNYTWIRMQIAGENIDDTMNFADKTGAALDPAVNGVLTRHAVVVLSQEPASYKYDGLKIVADMGVVAGQNVTIALVEAIDNSCNHLLVPLAPAENILAMVNGVSAKIRYFAGTAVVDGNATSTIDVESAPSRSKFVDEGRTGPFTGADTDFTHSEAGILVLNTAEYGLTLDGGDTYNITVKRDNVSGVTAVAIGGFAATAGVNEWTYTNNFGTLDLTAGTGKPVLITVDGTTILRPGMWQVDLDIDPDIDAKEPKDLEPMTLLADADSHDWDINGYQCTCPYFTDPELTTYSTFIRICNNFDQDAEVYVDVYTDDGNMEENILLGTVNAHECTAFNSAMIDDASTIDLMGDSFKIIFTVISPKKQVSTVVINKQTGVGRTTIPCYTTTPPNEELKW